MQQASVVVRQTDSSQFVKMMELVFQQQDSRPPSPAAACYLINSWSSAVFLTGAVNMTEPQVQKTIAEVLSHNLNIDYNRSTIICP